MPKQSDPITFTIRPLNKGLNKSKAPNKINEHEASDLMNVRFEKSDIQFRTGFRKKYTGPADPFFWVDTVYSLTEQRLIGISTKGVYECIDDHFAPCSFYDGSSTPISLPHLDMDPREAFVAVDAGFGRYNFQYALNGEIFPLTDNYETITFMCNNSDGSAGGIVAIVYEDGVQAERMTQTGAPSRARALAVWDGRLFVGAVTMGGAAMDSSAIRWTAKGMLSDWENGGFTTIGDSPDWIQAMRKLGEYLIVYKERSIFIGRQTFLADPPVRFDPAPGQGIGLAAPNSIGDMGEEHIFLGWDNVYMFSLKRLEDVGTQIRDELFYGKNGIIPSFLGNCTGVIAEEFDEYWLFVPTGKWPDDGLDGEGVVNVLADPLCEDTSEWTTDGSLSIIDGVIGEDAIHVDGTWIETNVEIGEPGLHSATVWLRGAEEQEATITLGAGSKTVELSDIFQRYVLSTDLSANTELRIESDSDFDIDASHVVRIEEVDDVYKTGSEGEITVGYLNAFDEPEEVPIIADVIAPYMADTCWVYNYAHNSWTCWRIPMTGFGYDVILEIQTIDQLEGTIAEQTWRFDEKRIEEFAPTNLLAQPDGQVYEMVKGVTKDFEGVLNRAFLAHWTSKDYDLKRPDIEKTVSKLTLHHETTHAPVNVTVGVSIDSGVNWEDQTVTINQGRSFTDVHMFSTGPHVMFRLSAVSPGFFIHGITVKLALRGETNVF